MSTSLDFRVKNGLIVGTDATVTGSVTATSFTGAGTGLTGFATVARSGLYSDLSGSPAIPTASSLSVDDLITLSGVAEGSTSLGSFTGTTIADNRTVKAALQDLETSVELKLAASTYTATDVFAKVLTQDGASSTLDADFLDGQHGAHYLDYNNFTNTPTIPTQASLSVDDLITLSGVAEGSTTLGTFTGTTISNSQTVKSALQELETAVETKAPSASPTITGTTSFSNTADATSKTSAPVTFAGGVGIAKKLFVGGDLSIEGNFTVGGTTTTVNAQNLNVSDNLIYLNEASSATITNVSGNGTTVTYTANNNYSAGMIVTITGVDPGAYNLTGVTIATASATQFTVTNSATGTYVSGGTASAKTAANPDLGWAGAYNDGTYAHAGMFRDASDSRFKVFKGYTPEPDASPYIDTADASFALADFQAAVFYGSASGLTGLPTQASLSVDDLITLTGVAEGATNLGTFTGTTITNNSTIKTALQELETKVEASAGDPAGTGIAMAIALG